MRWRAVIAGVGIAVATTLQAVDSVPAAALGSSADSSYGDFSVTSADGTTLYARILHPTPAASKPVGGWPMVVLLHGGRGHKCVSPDHYLFRALMVPEGFAVVTFTGRGFAPPYGAPTTDGGTSCDQLDLSKDSMNDSGHDMTGPTDRADVTAVINGAISWSNATNCPSPCVNQDKIGAYGYSYGGSRTWMMGIAGVDSRIKAIVPQAAGLFQSRPTVGQSGDGAGNPRGLELGRNGWIVGTHDAGKQLHTAPSVVAAKTQLERAEFLGQSVSAVNTTGAISSAPTKTLTLSDITGGKPSFTAADVGKPITVGKAVDGGASVDDRTLDTTISAYVSASEVLLADNATQTGTNLRVSWGTQAWFDQRTIVDENIDVDKAHHIDIPVFIVNGFYDLVAGYNAVSLPAAVEAWKKVKNPHKFLYLGSCGHDDPTCDYLTANGINLRDKLKAFLKRYVAMDGTSLVTGTQTNTTADIDSGSSTLELNTGSLPGFSAADVGRSITVVGAGAGGDLVTTISEYRSPTEVILAAPNQSGSNKTDTSATWKPCGDNDACVFYAMPPFDAFNPASPNKNWGAIKQTAAWPPSGASSQKLYLRWQNTGDTEGTLSTTAPPTGWVASRDYANDNLGLPISDACNARFYLTDSVTSYKTYRKAAEASDLRIAKLEADIVLSSSTTRMQVVVDVYDYYDDPSPSIPPVLKPMWQGYGMNVPYLRTGTAGTKYRFVFQPNDSAMTIPAGHQLHVNVAANFRLTAAQEPIRGTYTIWHKPDVSSEQSSITVWSA